MREDFWSHCQSIYVDEIICHFSKIKMCQFAVHFIESVILTGMGICAGNRTQDDTEVDSSPPGAIERQIDVSGKSVGVSSRAIIPYHDSQEGVKITSRLCIRFGCGQLRLQPLV